MMLVVKIVAVILGYGVAFAIALLDYKKPYSDARTRKHRWLLQGVLWSFPVLAPITMAVAVYDHWKADEDRDRLGRMEDTLQEVAEAVGAENVDDVEEAVRATTEALQKVGQQYEELLARQEEKDRELQRAAGERRGYCDRVAALTRTGRWLVRKLRETRAIDATRREIDGWFEAVCEVGSAAQCEAFLSAAPATTSWVNYPVQDGGYSQTLRGRVSHLSSVLATDCG